MYNDLPGFRGAGFSRDYGRQSFREKQPGARKAFRRRTRRKAHHTLKGFSVFVDSPGDVLYLLAAFDPPTTTCQSSHCMTEQVTADLNLEKESRYLKRAIEELSILDDLDRVEISSSPNESKSRSETWSFT